MFGVFFYVSLFMQQVLRFSPVEAGATFLPMTVLVIIVAPQAGRLTDKIGARWLVGAGLTLVSISLLLYTRLDVDSTFWTILPALIVGGFGMSMAMTPTTAAAMSAVSTDKAGVGSAVNDTTRELGGTLGVAIVGSVFASIYSSRLSDSAVISTLPEQVRATMERSMAAAQQVVAQLPQPVIPDVRAAVNTAFLDGLQIGSLVSAGIALAAAIVVAWLLPARARQAEQPQPEAVAA